MVKIIALMRAVSRAASQTSRSEKRRYSAANPRLPIAPTEADSVGVAIPAKIEPSTSTMSSSGGTTVCTTLCQGIRSTLATGGSHSGRTIPTTTVHSIYTPARAIPGRNAARNSSPTDTWSASPRTISTTDGGIICPNVPAAQMMPDAKRRS
jgi:hypothetical protein